VQTELTMQAGAAALIVGFPVLLFLLMALLGWLEAWMLRPDERAAELHRLLEVHEHAEDIEQAVVKLLAEVADTPRPRVEGPLRP
jgi:hypothetical protein